jgi:hypothetical protein
VGEAACWPNNKGGEGLPTWRMQMQMWREFFGEDGKLCLVVIAEADDDEGCWANIKKITGDTQRGV